MDPAFVAAAVAAEDGAPLAPSTLVGFIDKMRATWKCEADTLPNAAATAQGYDEGDRGGKAKGKGKIGGKAKGSMGKGQGKASTSFASSSSASA